jgi:hypothetical protein
MGEARLLLLGADLGFPGPAPLAPTAAADEGNGHPVTDPPTTNLRTHLGHDPGELMTRYMREHDLVMPRPGMPVTAAHPRGHDAHDHPAVRDCGIGHFTNRWLSLNSVNEYGAHPEHSANVLPWLDAALQSSFTRAQRC